MKKDGGKRGGRKQRSVEVPASEVKNAWHEYVDRVSRGHEEIVVTRYGKPIMKLTPMNEPEHHPVFGHLSGTVTQHADIVAPIGEAWEADG